MKKQIKNILLSLAVLSCLPACEFLSVEKTGKSDIETFFAESTSHQTAMYGTYNTYFSFYERQYLPYLVCVSDELIVSANSGDLYRTHNFQLTSNDETTFVGAIWRTGYAAINNSNQIIEHTEDLIKSYPKQRAHFLHIHAQALFIRALTHFQMCGVFGQNYAYTPDASHLGIPIIRHIPSLTEKIARSSVKDVYDAVIDDLLTAIPLFSSDFTDGPYFASRVAAKALLARVYLYKNDMANALKYAQEVIATEGISLTSAANYYKMYCQATEKGAESIFRLNGYKQTKEMGSIFNYESPNARPSEKLKSTMADGDVRKLFQCRMPQASGADTVMTDFTNVVMKYTCTDDVTIAKEDRYCSPFVLRMSEMYLICAEALNRSEKSTEAEDYLKAIVARSMGKKKEDVSLTWTNATDLDNLIQLERFKELCFEGHRFLDLTRRHQAIERDASSTALVKQLNYPDYRMVLPISYVETDANDAMEQNPNYE
ncbi:MAG: RagB/SusD family nutrient uptake outer membrane protein [Bacteroidales bacterium]|nr:RagB/SusD family nutrient uptake outer membrane protein [Bacteroidales bacterium]